jgi:hypothetical protein
LFDPVSAERGIHREDAKNAKKGDEPGNEVQGPGMSDALFQQAGPQCPFHLYHGVHNQLGNLVDTSATLLLGGD